MKSLNMHLCEIRVAFLLSRGSSCYLLSWSASANHVKGLEQKILNYYSPHPESDESDQGNALPHTKLDLHTTTVVANGRPSILHNWEQRGLTRPEIAFTQF